MKFGRMPDDDESVSESSAEQFQLEEDDEEDTVQPDKDVLNVGIDDFHEPRLSSGQHAQRQYVRNTVRAVGGPAYELLSSSAVAKYTLGLVEPVLTQFSAQYGDPLLTSIDDRLDAMIEALKKVTMISSKTNQAQSTPSTSPISNIHDTSAYWIKLKRSFMASHWFQRVDGILKASAISVEGFYSNAANVYSSSGDGIHSFESFLDQLRIRLGANWDDRLVQPAKVFFATAQAAAALMGVGRFVGGALNLGKSRIVSTVIEPFRGGWKTVLGATDDAVDRWLPESDARKALDCCVTDSESEEEVFKFDDMDDKQTVVNSSSGGSPISTGIVLHSAEPVRSVVPKRHRAIVASIASKLTRRVRQRIPSRDELKSHLYESSWFAHVNEILMQNVILRSLQSAAGQPAEHFFDTAQSSFNSNRRSVEDFLSSLRNSLGAAWDERLVSPAKAFYQTAVRFAHHEDGSAT